MKRKEQSARGYAVIDFEAVGVKPWHPAIEVGIALLSPTFEIESTFSTLIATEERVLNGHIHRIEADMLIGAPSLRATGAMILHLLSGRYVVAHNAGFERRHLGEYTAEELPKLIDTMPLAQKLTGQRKLELATAALGIAHEGAHAALSDALATAELLREAARRGLPQLREEISASAPFPEAPAPQSFRSHERAHGLSGRASWLGELEEGESKSRRELRTYSRAVANACHKLYLTPGDKTHLRTMLEAERIGLPTALQVHASVLSEMAELTSPEEKAHGYYLDLLSTHLGCATLGATIPQEKRLLEMRTVMLAGGFKDKQQVIADRFSLHGIATTKTMDEADFVVVSYADRETSALQEARRLHIPVLDKRALQLYSVRAPGGEVAGAKLLK